MIGKNTRALVVEEKLDCDFLSGSRWTVGSDPECDIRFREADPRHAVIRKDGGTLTIETIGASCISVNGGDCTRDVLRLNDCITLNGRRFIFKHEGLDPEITEGGRISIHSLTKEYPRKTAFRNVNLTVDPGSLVGILGPSGCGKSTLLKCLDGAGRNNNPKIKATGRACYVRQDDLHFEGLSVQDCLNTSAVYRIPGKNKQKKASSIREALKLVGLLDREDRQINELSGGEKKRLSIALELLYEPNILMLDEPTSSLDPHMQAEIMDVLKTITRKKGITVICVTHAVSTLPDYDRIVLMRSLEGANSEADSVAFNGTCESLMCLFPYADAKTFSELFHYLAGERVPHFENTFDDAEENLNLETEQQEQVEIDAFRPTGWFSVWQGIAVTFQRTMQALLETKRSVSGHISVSSGMLTLLFLPLLVGVLIYLAIAGRANSNMFGLGLALVLSLTWLSMTLNVRLIVAEREVCEREIRAGLSALGYLLGKVLVVVLTAFIQSFILCLAVLGMTKSRVYAPVADDAFNQFGAFLGISFIQVAVVLWIVAICGGMVGLLISCLPRTQSVGSQTLAVTLLPLFLIPHLLFNRSVIGETTMLNYEKEPAPIVAYAPLRYSSKLQRDWYRNLHHYLSIVWYSRPAINVIYGLNPPGGTKEARNINKGNCQVWFCSELAFLCLLMMAYVCCLLIIFYFAGPFRQIRSRSC